MSASNLQSGAEASFGIVQFEQQQDFLGAPTDGWYWRDDACEEWMGPFATLDEARADHRALRKETQKC